MANNSRKKIRHFILDADGVLTDGQYHYTAEGKVEKIYGPDDHDALLLLKKYMNIVFISGDKKGFPITQKRIEFDMKFPLHQVSTFERLNWIKEHFNPEEVVYMGDGIFDAMVFEKVAYAIAPANAFFKTKEYADYITNARGGEGAVAEACWHLAEKFFKPFDILKIGFDHGQGEWGGKKL
jgi:3-deoxy-D-manno-octulosonate 8-phosphate phosphatase (KDO 8-P phosphatase)